MIRSDPHDGLVLCKYDFGNQCPNKKIHPFVFLKSDIVQRKLHRGLQILVTTKI